MRLQHQLHLTGIDVEASGDDQLLDAATDRERAVLPDLTNVARAEEAFRSERLARCLGFAPVTPEDLAALEQHLVKLAKPHLDSWKCVTLDTWLTRANVSSGVHRDALR